MTEQEFKRRRGTFNYMGVLVTCLVGGWEIFGTKCKSKAEVDAVISQAQDHLQNSITIPNNGDMECTNENTR